MTMKYKSFVPEIKAYNDEQLWIDHFISTESRDRGGDVMIAEGMRLKGMPVVLWQHGHDSVWGYMPIAKPLEFRVGTNTNGAKGIIARTKFPDDEEGRKMYSRVKGGFLPNWSIGFQGKGIALDGGGYRYDEWELLEYSNVAVPMNAEATTGSLPSIKEYMAKAVTDVIPSGFVDAQDWFTRSEEVNGVERKSLVDGKIYYQDSDGVWIEKIPAGNDEEVKEAKSKGIAEECAGSIAWQSMMILIDKFLYSLHDCGGKKPVRKMMDDFHEAFLPYAEGYAEWSSSQQTDAVGVKMKWIQKKIRELMIESAEEIKEQIEQEEPQAQAQPEPVIEPAITEPTVEQIEEQKPPTEEPKPITISAEQIQHAIETAITKNAAVVKAQINKLLGRLD